MRFHQKVSDIKFQILRCRCRRRRRPFTLFSPTESLNSVSNAEILAAIQGVTQRLDCQDKKLDIQGSKIQDLDTALTTIKQQQSACSVVPENIPKPPSALIQHKGGDGAPINDAAKAIVLMWKLRRQWGTTNIEDDSQLNIAINDLERYKECALKCPIILSIRYVHFIRSEECFFGG